MLVILYTKLILIIIIIRKTMFIRNKFVFEDFILMILIIFVRINSVESSL
jgi:hypothetical protein